eukprot:gene8895-9846_t
MSAEEIVTIRSSNIECKAPEENVSLGNGLHGGMKNNIFEDKIKSNEQTSVNEKTDSIPSRSYGKSFLRRKWRNVFKHRRSSSASSYDFGSDLSTRSSLKEECLSENEERSEGIDSGIASETGGRTTPTTTCSSLSHCTNLTSATNGDQVPGLSGMHNLGNTCYMNAILQCLAHVERIVEYFVTERYRDDMKPNKKKKVRTKKCITTNNNISKGTLTESLADLLKSLWSFAYTKTLCQEFREIVCKFGEQYKGTSQQDAQEFLLWLLDCIHIDLHKTTTWNFYNKSVTVKKKKHYDEEELAARTLATHTQQNQSFIKKVFQAQYKSTLVCPNCETCSNTFDPFLCLSLPIPQKDTKPVYFTMVYNSNSQHQPARKFAVSVEVHGTVRDLKQRIATCVDIAEEKLIVCLAYDDGDHCSLRDNSFLDAIPEMDNCLFAFEVPGKDCTKPLPCTTITTATTVSVTATTANGHTSHSNSTVASGNAATASTAIGGAVDGLAASFNNRAGLVSVNDDPSILIIVTNVELKGRLSKRFGFPIAIRVSKDVTFKQLQILIRREMPMEIRTAINSEAKKWKLIVAIRVCGGLVNYEYLKEVDPHPLRRPTVERAISCNANAGPAHVSMVAEWEPACEDWWLAKYGLGHAVVDESVKLLEEEYFNSQKVALSDCFELHTKEEELQYEDHWKCPNCKTELTKTKKKLCLWSLPDVLVIHLKRFQQINHFKGKISADVSCPLYGLDMGAYVAPRTKVSPRLLRRYASSKKHIYSLPPEPVDCIYDLFAACNHIGPYITSGHYTANCKNVVNGKWYCFDDSEVTPLSEEQVCTRSAYLLFYQKRNTVSRSVSSSSLSSISSHWSNQLNQRTLATQNSDEDCQR